MKRFLVIVLVVSGITLGAFAQERVKKSEFDKKSYVRKEYVRKDMVKLSTEEIAKRQTDRLDKELKLTSKQRDEVYKIQLAQAKKIKNQQEARAKERKKVRKERLAQQDKFKKLLTTEQYVLWKNKVAKRSAKDFKRGKVRDRELFDRKNDSKRSIESKTVERDRRAG